MYEIFGRTPNGTSEYKIGLFYGKNPSDAIRNCKRTMQGLTDGLNLYTIKR